MRPLKIGGGTLSTYLQLDQIRTLTIAYHIHTSNCYSTQLDLVLIQPSLRLWRWCWVVLLFSPSSILLAGVACLVGI